MWGCDVHDQREAKWNKRYAESAAETPQPLEVLVDNAHLLPRGGVALDLASGLGGSALWLARRGFETYAWDWSDVAIEKLRLSAAGLPLTAQIRDVEAQPPEAGRFDVICVGHFLQRDLCTAIAAALKPGGVLFYQTFTQEKVDDSGPGNPDFRLAPNELLQLFSDLIVRYYRDEGTCGDIGAGFRNRAQLVAQQHFSEHCPGFRK